MTPSKYLVQERYLCFGLLVVALAVKEASSVPTSRKIGVQFLSYSIKDGRLPSGACCDGKTLSTGDCEPDQCDTSFSICAKNQAVPTGGPCIVTTDTTVIVDNNTITSFGSRLGSKSTDTTSLIIVDVGIMADIVMELTVLESDPPVGAASRLAHFSLLINWTDPFRSEPDWHTYQFHYKSISLSVNVSAFCGKFYFGPNCDTYCHPYNDTNHGHISCDAQGKKQCLPGWENLANGCKDMIDLCVSSPCKNGAACTPQLLGYTCTCAADYTGSTCDTKIPPSTVPTTATSTTTTTTTTTSATTASTTTTPTTTSSATTPTTSATTTTAETAPTTPFPTDKAQATTAEGIAGVSAVLIWGPLAGLLFLCLVSVMTYVICRRKKTKPVAPEKKKKIPDDMIPDRRPYNYSHGHGYDRPQWVQPKHPSFVRPKTLDF